NVSTEPTSTRAVLRNQFGDWIVDFNRVLDCLEVVKAIQEGYYVSSNSTLLQLIQQVL
ncbi:hypothetical protein Godav_018060, partial [Gossypium davidsonii]|nr:hypothetical protein [Gossypium davidsonii]MBA0640407.1 hypothetical protein [Gossypium klotzschianum]